MNRSTILDSVGFKAIVYAYVVGVGLILSGVAVLFMTQ